ncbi:bifunctional adenosylcobinamide kinase/adenosylcobinamide-phosphate guanylyltransferase [Cognatishimia activa]|uniref:bifunctional adenosylcobinamide kinase/adenosylcobinamide-phosphate guanylyltransferase n=1 Tax=Cognatishimia activa TaxID=1715691 RepID=UPI00222EB1C0|nr:bifunctional adenosylcobinamide kinase/adenosylcobinamide-phosphate guanylyltransferase [Cognatishimia activa]UZD90116.1 bifunctional adenosylcobinamide kinase/adenosylcobinamide-phosphate guanylyltransferase [Cognatishimia activa]
MLPKLSFVLGGAASGKSAFAEGLVVQTGAPKVYVATAEIYDDEMRAKVDAHLEMRGETWRTIEAPQDLTPALESVRSDEVVLLDCATMWLSNQVMAESDLVEETDRLLAAINNCAGRVVVVSNEVGMGIVPDNALARRFRDKQGKLNQRIAAEADLAVFVIAGLPTFLKGQLR